MCTGKIFALSKKAVAKSRVDSGIIGMALVAGSLASISCVSGSVASQSTTSACANAAIYERHEAPVFVYSIQVIGTKDGTLSYNIDIADTYKSLHFHEAYLERKIGDRVELVAPLRDSIQVDKRRVGLLSIPREESSNYRLLSVFRDLEDCPTKEVGYFTSLPGRPTW